MKDLQSIDLDKGVGYEFVMSYAPIKFIQKFKITKIIAHERPLHYFLNFLCYMDCVLSFDKMMNICLKYIKMFVDVHVLSNYWGSNVPDA